jgi:hypothetical protein
MSFRFRGQQASGTWPIKDSITDSAPGKTVSVGMLGIENRQHSDDAFGKYHIIGINEPDIVSRQERKRKIPSPAYAPVSFRLHENKFHGMRRPPTGNYRGDIIRGTIVDHDDFSDLVARNRPKDRI